MSRVTLVITAYGVMAFLACGEDLRADEHEKRMPGLGRFAAVAPDTFGSPRWDKQQRVHGFLLILNTNPPKNCTFYDAAVFVQVRRGKDDWEYVPAASVDGAKLYTSQKGWAYDFIRVREKAEVNASVFIPHAVLDLKPGRADLRFLAAFYRNGNGNDRIAELDKVISTLPVRITQAPNRIVIDLHGGDLPPIQIIDFANPAEKPK